MRPRSAKEAGRSFPYKASTTCYIEVWNDGTVTHGTDDGTYRRALTGESRLFAVWPGEWSSHLFLIDDLDEYARAVGIEHDQERTGLAEHVHDVQWVAADGGGGARSQYVDVRLSLGCGCAIHDLRVFAAQMREQRGWDIATSVGWGSSSGPDGTDYSLRIRRKSLDG
ncbi:hypothetical protein [Streptomyces sp. URMC 129]|uniref:hypothetical protein n=1 Tax=Streptomyces sp. URMC 129 TaxID=3423407 RepID=UPI003F193418